MILDIGEKVHIIERRYFDEDPRRHLIGEITGSTENAIRVKRHVWVFDRMKGTFIQKPEERERVIYPGDRTNINIIPREVDMDKTKYVTTPERSLVVTDGKKFILDINEFGPRR
jgi:hypothetical protein